MGAEFESQWSASWFRDRAALCFRLAKSCTDLNDAAELRSLGEDFEDQAKKAEMLGPVKAGFER